MNEEILPRGVGEVAVALGYPNTRTIAAGNLGFQILSRMLAAIPGVRVEHFFLSAKAADGRSLPRGADPPRGRAAAADRRRRATPAHAGYGMPLKLTETDLVLVSLSYEGDAPAVPAMLVAGSLPAFAAQRRPGHPLVIAGGAAVMINPEPLAAFFDLFLIGEAEELLIPFLRVWGMARRAPRDEALAALDEGVPGALAPARRPHRIWTPAADGLIAHRLVQRPDGPQWRVPADTSDPSRAARGLADANAAPGGSVAVDPDRVVRRVIWEDFCRRGSALRLPAEAQVGQSYLLELARGCPRRCRFCAASRIYAPLRETPADILLAQARAEVYAGETVGLLSLSAGDYSGLETLAEGLSQLKVRLAISSLPAGFARPAAARLLASGTRTLTLAPETGTDRLRALIGKPIAEAAILRAAAALGAAGLRHLRTYFIIGLPFEEDADAAGIGTLLARLRERLPARCTLSATVNAFVPKPGTPFQWAAMAPLALLRERAALVQRRAPRGVSLRIKSFRQARLQALLTRGDVTWGPRLARMAADGASVAQVLQGADPDSAALLGPIQVGAGLPWTYLLGSEEHAALEREWLALAQGPGQPAG